MNNGLFMVGLFLVFGVQSIWLVFAKNLSNHLEKYHHDVFMSLGEPKVPSKSFNAKGRFNLFKFMLFRKHKPLNDRYIRLLSDGFLVCIIIYLVIWAICFNFVLQHL